MTLITLRSERDKQALVIILQVSALMEKFEKQFENLDVQTNYMETAMSDTTTLTVPQVGTKELIK